jgi:hypothetical protein
VAVCAPLEHVPGAHTVEVPGVAPHARRLDPSHCASHAPVPVHAVRLPCG